MALSASKVSSCPIVPKGTTKSRSYGVSFSFAQSPHYNELHSTIEAVERRQISNGHILSERLSYFNKRLWHKRRNITLRQFSISCQSTGTHKTTKSKESIRPYGKSSDVSSVAVGTDDEHPIVPGRIISSGQGLAEACKYACNDAKFVNERARNDIVLLSRGIMSLDARARKDVAIIGSGFLKLDARAREDTEKIDRDVKRKAEFLNHIATVLKAKAQFRLKTAADKHWSDGALEADLRRADFRAKQRAMEDALMALEFVKNIHDMMVSRMYKLTLCREEGSLSANDVMGRITLEKNGKTLNSFPGELSSSRITVIQEAYWRMASALSEADGIDYTDPEELELLIATLIDLDAMDGKSSASLLAECSSSPDVNTRQALANALAAAPSMWTLGNAGMGALKRLAEDSNPAIAAAASKTIYELRKQWEIDEGDSWTFMMNRKPMADVDGTENDDPDTI
ncbi:hypothetical protein HS088_TW13G00708 [Tripterygium wilfordii]|uniref:Senescence-associated family protein n=1 Tax=Tripterygium wilfordii TaxID=458696 RepID=A0A7J7CUN9_TRIWF|nr:senescence-associated protein AAF, chlorolplastic [Tripterygium wilfordii]KAF5737817.1 hypothetical protein HS088_TW13G00708 [Tripterygium wilfordii]